ncbi:MAG: hypothetical protein AAFR16_11635 [Pseudomonadota bacterium]
MMIAKKTYGVKTATKIAAAGVVALMAAGCATTDNNTLNRTAIGAGGGAVAGGVLGAVSPGVSVVGGLAGGAAIGAAGGFLYDQVKKNQGEPVN